MERATELKNVHVHFVATTTRLPPDAQKALALRAASGDRTAEAQALDSIRPVSLAIVNAMVANNSRLRPHKPDLISEALTLTVEAIRAYNGRSQLAGWVTMFVGGRLRRHAWKEYTADVPGVRISHHGRADFEQPVFRGRSDLYEAIVDRGESNEREAIEAKRVIRRKVAIILKKLPTDQREIVRRRYGIAERSCEVGSARRRAAIASTRPESLKAIADDFDCSDEYIRKRQNQAKDRLGMEKTARIGWCKS